MRQYQADVWRFAYHFTRDRTLADDVTQDAFLARPLPPRVTAIEVLGSLFQIARNCAMDRSGPATSTSACDTDRRRVRGSTARIELHAALDAVSADHRGPFLLVEVFGCRSRRPRRARRARRDDSEPDPPGAPGDDGARSRSTRRTPMTTARRAPPVARIDGEHPSPRAEAALGRHLASCATSPRSARRVSVARRRRFELAPPSRTSSRTSWPRSGRAPPGGFPVVRRHAAVGAPPAGRPRRRRLLVGAIAGSLVVGGPSQDRPGDAASPRPR